MLITIKTMTNKTIILESSLESTILELKEQISDQVKLASQEQRLILYGCVMIDRYTIQYYESLLLKVPHIDLVHQLKLSNTEFIPTVGETDVKFLWAVRYLDEKDAAFETKALQLIVSDDLETAFASYQKRHNNEAKGQTTYLSLIAVREEDLKNRSDATDKYQPEGDKKMDEYTGLDFLDESDSIGIPICSLLVVIPTNESGLKIIENSKHDDFHLLPIYQSKLQELQKRLGLSTLKIDGISESKFNFNAIEEIIKTEIKFNVEDSSNEENIMKICEQLDAFTGVLKSISNLPVLITTEEVNLTNILLSHLNASHNLIDASIPHIVLIQHIMEFVNQCVDELKIKKTPDEMEATDAKKLDTPLLLSSRSFFSSRDGAAEESGKGKEKIGTPLRKL